MNGSLPARRSKNTDGTRNGIAHPHAAALSDTAALGTTDTWVELLKTLSDPIRLRILRLLEQQAHQGLSVGELADVLKLPQSTVSRHLKTLCDNNLTAVTRDGTSMLYRLSDNAAEQTVHHLRTLARSFLDRDPIAKSDHQRLIHILRQRESAAEKFLSTTAPQWDQIRQQWFGNTFHLDAMLSLLNPHATIGDIGTGTGSMLSLVAPHVQKVIGIEPLPAMLKAARTRVKDEQLTNVEVLQGSVEHLPLKNATLDIALLTLVLHHVVDPQSALKEIHRVLKPGGLLLIIDLQPHTVSMFRDQMGHRWMGFDQPTLTDWLQNAGFPNTRWHALPAQQSRSKENSVTVPDLFALRAEATS